MASKIASVFLGFTLFFSAAAAAINPTPEQIEQFKKLPVEQQRALAKQYGVDLDSVSSLALPIPPPVVDTPTVVPRNIKERERILLQAISDPVAPGTPPKEIEEKSVKQKLEQFGYDLFAGAPSTFAPATNIPVPSEYIIGPGDTVVVQIYGKENSTYELSVSREGALQLPEIGPISVVGLNFRELKALLSETIANKIIGVNVSITMGALRSIQIFVLGEAFRPGAYTISALSTMTNALFVSGGVKEIGSLRRVQLKRKGKIESELDLYDLLLKGDTSGDSKLFPGDVIFIPPLGKTVGIMGEVRRPALYEIKDEKTMKEVIHLAGGLLPTAYPGATRVDRIMPNGDRTLIDVDLGESKGLFANVSDGDLIRILPVLDRVEDVVLISGHVQRPGGISWRKGMKVRDAIPAIERLLPDPDLNYALIKREKRPESTIEIINLNLGELFMNGSSEHNLMLQPRDEILIFGMNNAERKKLVKDLVKSMRSQAASDKPARIVSITGSVKFPGEYPLAGKMTAKELIAAAGGLTESAYSINAEMTRASIDLDGQQVFSRISLAIEGGLLVGGASLNVPLQPHDQIYIRKVPNWNDKEYVEIVGEVNFPGTYPILPGDSIKKLVDRAGGANEYADISAAVFTRDALRKREEEQIARLKRSLEADLARMKAESLQTKLPNQDKEKIGADLLGEISVVKPIGRLVVDLPSILKGGEENDIELVKGDRLVIPRKSYEITVVGEVQFPASHVYRNNFGVFDYIEISGGLSPKANEEYIYVISSNGEVKPVRKKLFLADNIGMKPGDTVVVPLDTQSVSAMTGWMNVSQILFNLSTTAAALKTVGVF